MDKRTTSRAVQPFDDIVDCASHGAHLHGYADRSKRSDCHYKRNRYESPCDQRPAAFEQGSRLDTSPV